MVDQFQEVIFEQEQEAALAKFRMKFRKRQKEAGAELGQARIGLYPIFLYIWFL